MGPPSSPASRAQRAHCQRGRSWTRTENRPSQPRSRELQRAGACLLSHQNRTGQTLAKFARNGGCRALAAPAEAAAGVVTVPAQRTIRHENQAGLVRRGGQGLPAGSRLRLWTRPCTSRPRGLRHRNTTGLAARPCWAEPLPGPFPLFNDPLSVGREMKASYTTPQMCISLAGVRAGRWVLADSDAQRPETRAQRPAPGVSGCSPSSRPPLPRAGLQASRAGVRSLPRRARRGRCACHTRRQLSDARELRVPLRHRPAPCTLLACRWAARGAEPLWSGKHAGGE